MISELFLVSGMHLATAVAPGPSTMVLCCTAATRSRRAGLVLALGLTVGSALLAGAAIAGISAASARLDGVLDGLNDLAGVVLTGIGLRMILRRGTAAPVSSRGNPFLLGLLTSLSNPLSLAFWFGAFLAAMPAGASTAFRAAALGLVTVQGLVWYSCLALVCSSSRHVGGLRQGGFLNRAGGVAMVLAGMLALSPA